MAKPCGCGKIGGVRNDTTGIRTGYTPAAGRNGVIELANYPENFTPYNGKQRQASVFVIGLPSEPDDERIFLRSDSTAAIAYAREKRLRLHHLPARELCEEAMLALFGE
jgi:hypothetical protein